MKKQFIKRTTVLILTLVMLLSVFPATAFAYDAELGTFAVEYEVELQEQPREDLELKPIEALPLEVAEVSSERRNVRSLEGGLDLNADNDISRDILVDAFSENQAQPLSNYFFFSVNNFITQPQGWAYLIVDLWPGELLQVQVDMPNSGNIDYDVYLDLFTGTGWVEVDSSELWTFINGAHGTLSESVGWVNNTNSIQTLAIIVESVIGFSNTLPFTMHVAATTNFSDYEVDSIFSPRNFTLNSNEPLAGRLDTRADSDWFSFTVPAVRDFDTVNISLDSNSRAAGHVVELYTLQNNFMARKIPISDTGYANVTTGTFFVRVDTNMRPTTGMNYSVVVTPAQEQVPPPVVNSVTIAPGFISQIARGSTRQFTATVQGPNNPPQDVVWSIENNSSPDTTISTSGLLSVAANENASVFTVRATSVANSAISRTALVSLPGTIIGNNTPATAHNIGRWSPTLNVPTTALTGGENAAYYRFTANPRDRFYARVNYNSAPGMRIEILNANGTPIRGNTGVVDRGNLMAFMFVWHEVPANAANNTQFLIRVSRTPSTPNPTATRFFSPAFRDLFRNTTETFNFTGTATNQGNWPFEPGGRNSTELRLDMRNNNSIPQSARVRSVTTSSQMTPAQGNVRHHLGNSGLWFTSTVSSANSGTYNITVDNGLPLRALWTFRYNAQATASSTMRNVSMRVTYEFDVTEAYRARES
ncbi:MAG: hypothetical protein FWC13_12500 [Oscillospiraceae bacterium]|nr:hypothetical protein [Oscillospiraceae bacterium]